MDVVNRGGETDDNPFVNRNGDMMSRVSKKFPRHPRVDWIVENVFGDALQYVLIAALKDLNFDRHRVASFGHATLRRRHSFPQKANVTAPTRNRNETA